MNNEIALHISHLTIVGGLAIWMALIVANNTIAFRNGVFAIGMLMKMSLFDVEPRIVSPLQSRSVQNAFWHRVIYTIILGMEAVTAVLLLFAAFQLGMALVAGGAASAPAWATLALTSLLATALVMLIGGAWFAYYIKQEGAQITHFALIGVALAGLILVNLG